MSPCKCFRSLLKMSKVFVKFNTGVPASAACEQLFNVGKVVFRAKRNQLSGKIFEDCSCIVSTGDSALATSSSARAKVLEPLKLL